MRLIDADALVRIPWVLPNRMTRETALECFGNIVNEAPAIEAEPVVRCKNCKHRGMPYACPMCYEECYSYDDYYEYYTTDCTKDEGFCDRGERWEESADD